MKTYTPKEIKARLEAHALWLESFGEKGSRAYLSGADLRRADLRGAYLSGADLRRADLSGAVGYSHPMSCPTHGEFIAWKKALVGKHYALVQLTIPADAKRLSATGRKCRCNKALVVAITDLRTNEPITECVSLRDHNFTYVVGKEVVVDDFDENRWNECSTGVHFFIDRQEALDYVM